MQVMFFCYHLLDYIDFMSLILNTYVVQNMAKAKTFFVRLPLAVNHFTAVDAVVILSGVCFLQPLEAVWFFFKVTAEHAEYAPRSVTTSSFQAVRCIRDITVHCAIRDVVCL